MGEKVKKIQKKNMGGREQQKTFRQKKKRNRISEKEKEKRFRTRKNKNEEGIVKKNVVGKKKSDQI